MLCTQKPWNNMHLLWHYRLLTHSVFRWLCGNRSLTTSFAHYLLIIAVRFYKKNKTTLDLLAVVKRQHVSCADSLHTYTNTRERKKTKNHKTQKQKMLLPVIPDILTWLTSHCEGVVLGSFDFRAGMIWYTCWLHRKRTLYVCARTLRSCFEVKTNTHTHTHQKKP